MDWRPYKDCCSRYAADVGAGFCPDCGHAFLRCLGFPDCTALIVPGQACPACFNPILLNAAGAVVQAKKGDRISVPLILRNGSSSGRPLQVKHIARIVDGGDDVPLRLTWGQIDAGGKRLFNLDTPPLADGGTYTFSVLLVLSTHYGAIEETYAFQGSISGRAATQDTTSQSTHIHVEGGANQALFNLKTSNETTHEATPISELSEVPLQRGDSYELANGIRGYKAEGIRVLRSVDLTFAGFKVAEVPEKGDTLTVRGRMRLGRNARTSADLPSDVCLRAYDSRTGAPDEPATMAISRRHFEFVVANDRLYVQVQTPNGIAVNKEVLPEGVVKELHAGDKLAVIPDHPDRLGLQLAFTRSLNRVQKISLTRTPAAK